MSRVGMAAGWGGKGERGSIEGKRRHMYVTLQTIRITKVKTSKKV